MVSCTGLAHQYGRKSAFGPSLCTGTYETYEGSPASKGQLQHDLWGVKAPSVRWDWDGLRGDITKQGLRNSLLVAPMPTASTSQVQPMLILCPPCPWVTCLPLHASQGRAMPFIWLGCPWVMKSALNPKSRSNTLPRYSPC